MVLEGESEEGGREEKRKASASDFPRYPLPINPPTARSLSHHFPYPLLYYIIAIFFFRLAFEMDDTVPIFLEIKPDIMFCGKV